MLGSQVDHQDFRIRLWPTYPSVGERMFIAFRPARLVGGTSEPRYRVTVVDQRHRTVATILSGPARAMGGIICVEWDGTDDHGMRVPPGAYQIRVQGVQFSFELERTIHLALGYRRWSASHLAERWDD